MIFNNLIKLLACIFLLIGSVECFAGFKTMKATLTIWGFFVGSMIGVVVGVTTDSTIFGVTTVLLLGVGLAILSFKLYQAGIFLLTAFLTTVALYLLFENIFVAVMIAILIGVLSVYIIKPVVIITTAVSGAGIILSSAYLIMNLEIGANPVITAVLWIPMALAGIACQYITTPNTKAFGVGMKSPNPSRTFSERKYPGMQRAYRNFCIKCGCEMFGTTGRCPRCGFSLDD